MKLFRGCTGKHRYRSRVDALTGLSETDRRAKRNSRQAQARAEIRAYRCPHCHGWHLTSHPKPDGLA